MDRISPTDKGVISRVSRSCDVHRLDPGVGVRQESIRGIGAKRGSGCSLNAVPSRTVGVIQDISERRQAEKDRAQLNTVVESAADGIAITDDRGVVQYVNAAFESITGYTWGDVVGRDLHVLDSGKHDDNFFLAIREALKHERFWRGLLASKKKDGTIYQEECTISPVRDLSGEIINYVFVKRDISERLMFESVARAVNTMSNIGYIFSGIRHEIGNPINSVELTLSMLEARAEKFPAATVREYLSRARNELSKVRHLLGVLKHVNMHESLELKDMEVAPFLETFLALVRSDNKWAKITVGTSYDPEAKACFADSRALHQVLLNVFTNAFDACEGRAAPWIGIQVSKEQGKIRFRVVDNGCGMSREQQATLFKPFVSTKDRGTGLGLVISKEMLEAMGGTIEIESEKNAGTKVDIWLMRGRSERR